MLPGIGSSRTRSPAYLLIMLVALVFLAEAALMLLLAWFPALPKWAEAVIDATAITALLFPVIYYFFYNPAELHAVNEQLAHENESRRLAEEKLIARQHEISALLEASSAVLAYRAFPETARAIFDISKKLIGASGGYVALLNKDGTNNDVLFLDSGGMPCTVDTSLPMPIRGLRGDAYTLKKAVYHNDFFNSEWAKFMPAGHMYMASVLFAPLVTGDKAVGLIGLANKPGGFTDNDVLIAEAMGRLVAIALINSHVRDHLEDSELRHRTVVQTATDAIITVDQNGAILLWNKSAEEMYGYSGDEMAGKPLSLLFPEKFREQYGEKVRQIFADGEPFSERLAEYVGKRKDGVEFPVECSTTFWRTKEGVGFTTIARDITRRKMIEKALRESHDDLEKKVAERTGELLLANAGLAEEIEERRRAEKELLRLATAVEGVSEVILIADDSGSVQYVNPAFEKVTGFPRKEALGMDAWALASGAGNNRGIGEIQAVLRSGKSWSGQLTSRKKDGTRYDELVTISPITDASGKIMNFVMVKRDMSSESLLRKAREYFTLITAHELRTPLTKLNLLKSFVEGRRGGTLGPDDIELALAAMNDSCGALDGIVAATSLIADLHRPRQTTDFTNVYLAAELRAVLGNTESMIGKERRKVHLAIDLDAWPRDLTIRGNQNMVSKMMDNILSNAVKYTPDGRSVLVMAKRESGCAVLEVSDEGIGIPGDRMQAVFEPYYSVENVNHHSTGRYKFMGGGIGLGLTVSRLIMEYHGGSLAIDSPGENMGTKVTLRFPVAIEENAPMAG